MNITYYRQPRYFGDFHCVGDACPDNCCYDWQIIWNNKEVNKLRTAQDCSPELKELIEKSFTTKNAPEGSYLISFDENKRCPFQTEDNLCRIQRELGVEYMSQTCMVYPRVNFLTEDILYRACHSSCREIMRRLINDETSMDLVNVPPKMGETINTSLFLPEELIAYPELKYWGELFEFFYELIADKRHSVETNIIIGALAAQALTKLIDRADEDKIPEAISQLRSQAHNAAQLKAIENIKPNYHLRFGFIGDLLREIVGTSVVDMLNDSTGTPNIDRYNAASAQLDLIFKDRPFFLRNIALNLLLETNVPFKFKEHTVLENYSLFAAAYACVKLNMIALAIIGKSEFDLNLYGREIHYDGENKFYGLTSMICRGLFHNPQKQESIINRLANNGFTTPAYIALLVK